MHHHTENTRRDKTRRDETRRNETGRDKTSTHLDRYIYKNTYTCTNKYVYIYKKRPVQPDPSNDPKRAPGGILPQTSSQLPQMATKQQPDLSSDHQTTTVHDHGALSKYNRTHLLDLRDSIFGSNRQMTITPQKMRMENIKKTERKRMANKEFSTSFFLVQIGAESTAGAKHQEMRMVPRVPNGKKTESFLILPFCGLGRLNSFRLLCLLTTSLCSRGHSGRTCRSSST